MSYSRGLGSLPTSTVYPSGTQLAAGYKVEGIAAGTSASVPAAASAAMQARFPNVSIVGSGWGPQYGVPAAHVYVLVQTQYDGVLGSDANAAFAAAGAALQASLPGSRVTNTNASLHQLGSGGAGPAPTGLTSSVSPSLIAGGAVAALLAAGAIYVATRKRQMARNRRRR